MEFSGISSERARNRVRSYVDSLLLESSTGGAAPRALVAYREKLVSAIRVIAGGQLLSEAAAIAPF